MFPILFEIPIFGGLKVHTYGFLVALGFLAGIFWVNAEAKRLGLSATKLTDLCVYLVLAGVLGSRVFYFAFEAPHVLLDDPLVFFRIWEGGLVFYGGFIFALLYGAWYFYRHSLSFWKMADVFVPALSIGHAFGRLGCFSAGCCYGRPVDAAFHFLGVTFPNSAEGLAPAGIAIYPTQLMEAAGELVIFLTLVFLRKKKKFEGELMLLYLLLYAALRFSLEFLRDDTPVFAGLRAAQYISLGLVFFALLAWRTVRRQTFSKV